MQQLSNINYRGVVKALADNYISLHIFNLKDGSLDIIKSNEHIDKWSEGIDTAQEALENVMQHIVSEEDMDKMLDFINLSMVGRRIKEDNASLVFNGLINGYCCARFLPLEYDENGRLTQVLFSVECVDEEKKRENHLTYLAQTDIMTGISNRGHGETCIREALENGKTGLFCLFDIDHFKQVNDFYGHKVGDQVLIAVANCMKRAFRSDDVVLRLGGDEFAFYAYGVEDHEIADMLIDRLFKEIGSILVEPMKEPISVSLGAAFYEEGIDFDQLYRKADEGVYLSKRSKGSSRYYNN